MPAVAALKKQHPMLDLRFQHFGKWFVQGCAPGKSKARFWVCQCECGTQAEIHEDALVEERAKSCGCDAVGIRRGQFKDIVGQRFSTYLVLAPVEKVRGVNRQWLCICCQCGKKAIIFAQSLLRSSGCASCAKTRPLLNGQRFGPLFVIRSAGIKKGNQYYECLCSDCGENKIVAGYRLARRRPPSCKARISKYASARIEKRYGFLEVIEYIPGHTKDGKKVRAQCVVRCQCGHQTFIDAQTLRASGIRSCHKCHHLYRRSLAADIDTWDAMITASAQRQQGVQA